MNLIDLDKLLLQVKMRRYTKASLSLLYNQELVDAIPVEWMKSWSMKNWVKSNKCEYDIIVSKMIDEWRKENETN